MLQEWQLHQSVNTDPINAIGNRLENTVPESCEATRVDASWQVENLRISSLSPDLPPTELIEQFDAILTQSSTLLPTHKMTFLGSLASNLPRLPVANRLSRFDNILTQSSALLPQHKVQPLESLRQVVDSLPSEEQESRNFAICRQQNGT